LSARNESSMQDTIVDMRRLLADVTEQLKSREKADRSAAIKKLRRIADLATTLAFTVEAQP